MLLVLLQNRTVVWRTAVDVDVRDWQPHVVGDPTLARIPNPGVV